VTAGTKKLLLGVTASNITVLAELSDDDISAMTPESDPSDSRSFGDIFAENMKKTFGGNKKGGIK
jgi:flagellar biogenesis protein FliO